MTTLNITHCRSRRDLEHVVDLCSRSFQNTPREYFVRHILCDGTLRPEDTLVGWKDGRIVTSVQVFPRYCWVEGHRMRFAGIGNVATDPAERRKGYAGQMLREAIRRMKADGFAFSILTTTINAYYAKFGFLVIPREAAVFANAPISGIGGKIRTFDRLRDLASVTALYDMYNRNSVGPVSRDRAYWNAQFQFCGEDPAMFLVLEHNKHVIGYVRGAEDKGTVQVLEFAAAEDESASFSSLLGSIFALKQGKPVKMFLSLREKERLGPLPEHSVQKDTDTMVLILDEKFRRTVARTLMRPGAYMFWGSDFF
jgi:predicted acetyltransferase